MGYANSSIHWRLEKRLSALNDFIQVAVSIAWFADHRVHESETIPYAEKLRSEFEPYTESINRGEFPIEFGHRTLIVKDQAGFIFDHHVAKAGLTDN